MLFKFSKVFLIVFAGLLSSRLIQFNIEIHSARNLTLAKNEQQKQTRRKQETAYAPKRYAIKSPVYDHAHMCLTPQEYS